MVWILRPWISRGGLGYLLLLAFAVLCFCGVGFWALEPQAKTLGDGMWLAFTTAATVGYGDLVPSTPAAKIFSVFVVLLGYAVLSLVTAAIAAIWVESSERRMEHDILRELHREVSALRTEVQALRAQRDEERTG
ncbi:MAG: ion transporter [Roseateles depolymerans]|uniref:Ion transporter n=1 Tax=Roseateles depolymerans TaxID=76731 RepID=A0A2W5FE49_9BURK|nr:MAG: ion transporter [Roseateles depolymerans]